jgi:hypothetical protein
MHTDVIASLGQAAAKLRHEKQAGLFGSAMGLARRAMPAVQRALPQAAKFVSRPGATAGAARVFSPGRTAATAAGAAFGGGHAYNAAKRVGTNIGDSMGWTDPTQRFRQYNQDLDLQTQELQKQLSQATASRNPDEMNRLRELMRTGDYYVGERNPFSGKSMLSHPFAGLNPFAPNSARQNMEEMERARDVMSQRFNTAQQKHTGMSTDINSRIQELQSLQNRPGLLPQQQRLYDMEMQSLKQQLGDTPGGMSPDMQKLQNQMKAVNMPLWMPSEDPMSGPHGMGGGGGLGSSSATSSQAGNYMPTMGGFNPQWSLAPSEFSLR